MNINHVIDRVTQIPPGALEVWYLSPDPDTRENDVEPLVIRIVGYVMSLSAGRQLAANYGCGHFKLCSMCGHIQETVKIRPKTKT